MTPSASHLVLIPSYNPGHRLASTVRDARSRWAPVWVVDDASTDGSADALPAATPHLRILRRPTNGGKGAAVFTGARAALNAGFTHALVLDADGQHDAAHIPPFMEASLRHPDTLILGRPVFGPEAPQVRLQGRKLSVGLVHLELLGNAVQDPLFGFRVYPLRPLVDVLARTSSGRRYDFDPEVAVRLVWAGTPTLNLPAPCRYLSRDEGGVSHFHYVRDNVRMVALHTRLLLEFAFRHWPARLRARRTRQPAAGHP